MVGPATGQRPGSVSHSQWNCYGLCLALRYSIDATQTVEMDVCMIFDGIEWDEGNLPRLPPDHCH